MDFEEIVEKVLTDERIQKIPILFVLQVLFALDDMGII